MPTLTKVFTVTVTPEQFLENCSDLELQELDLLIQLPRYAHRIVQLQEMGFVEDENYIKNKLNINHEK
jgi:hypothetical protein